MAKNHFLLTLRRTQVARKDCDACGLPVVRKVVAVTTNKLGHSVARTVQAEPGEVLRRTIVTARVNHTHPVRVSHEPADEGRRRLCAWRCWGKWGGNKDWLDGPDALCWGCFKVDKELSTVRINYDHEKDDADLKDVALLSKDGYLGDSGKAVLATCKACYAWAEAAFAFKVDFFYLGVRSMEASLAGGWKYGVDFELAIAHDVSTKPASGRGTILPADECVATAYVGGLGVGAKCGLEYDLTFAASGALQAYWGYATAETFSGPLGVEYDGRGWRDASSPDRTVDGPFQAGPAYEGSAEMSFETRLRPWISPSIYVNLASAYATASTEIVPAPFVRRSL